MKYDRDETPRCSKCGKKAIAFYRMTSGGKRQVCEDCGAGRKDLTYYSFKIDRVLRAIPGRG